jgi:PPK2 family polyphosphate:nucleotide phosphotransferase
MRAAAGVADYAGRFTLEFRSMSLIDDFIDTCRVPHDRKIKLKKYDSGWQGNMKVPKAKRKETAAKILADGVAELAEMQTLLYAADTWSLLIIFQAMDAAGKDGTIKHVMTGLNPQGCQVYSFKKPSAEELDHDFLWRCAKALPERGRIGIFNRSYYEEVLVTRIHPEIVQAQRLPKVDAKAKHFWADRYDDINGFERHLTRNGTRIVKFYLNVSKNVQKKRFLERIDDPAKHWKLSVADLAEREHWDDYQRAYEDMLNATSTKYAPWYIVPADNKWVTRASVAAILAKEIRSLKLSYPRVSDADQRAIRDCRAKLEAE